jgi:hypothetical protein
MQTLVYHTGPRTTDTVKENIAELLQTPHIRLDVCDVACSIVFTCSSNRRHIDLNICFAKCCSLWDWTCGTPGICYMRKCKAFSCFWVRVSIEFPALLPCFQRTRGTGRVRDLLKGNRYESIAKNIRQTCVEKKALTNKSSRSHLYLVTCCGRSGAIKPVRSVMRMCRHFYLTATNKSTLRRESHSVRKKYRPILSIFCQIKLPDRSYSWLR